jgi:hypothetical protein
MRMPHPDAIEYLSTADAARLIDRTPATVRRAAALGLLRVAASTRSGVRLFRRADIEQYVADRKVRRSIATGQSDSGSTSANR